ncbi:MAG TPA: ZIP family metal transporter [Candidatus Saccharibacteria bacterium]|nr:ZIP family metal transporter [Candidatus Saccharibacteria bacterium]
MANLGQVIIFSLLGGVVSLIGGILLLSSRKTAEKLAVYATPFAGGALLAAVFLDLLKEGVESSPIETVMIATLSGILIFFIAEGFLHWFHHHHEHSDKQNDPKISLIVAGDLLHNALDGVAIAASFLISVPTGVITTMAVAAHEIPQEIGDFGLLLSKGMRRRNVLLVNLISALATVLFAVLTFMLGSEDKLPLGALLGLSAGFLLYIAMSDVIPTIHNNKERKNRFTVQALLLLLGVLFVGLSIEIAHKYVDAGHEDSQSSNCVTYYDKDGAEVIDQDCEDPDHKD